MPLVNSFWLETEPPVLKELIHSLQGQRLDLESLARLLKLLEWARTTPVVTLPLCPLPPVPPVKYRGGFIGLIQRSLNQPSPKPGAEICRMEKSTLDDLFGIVAEAVQALGSCANQEPQIFSALLEFSRVDVRPWDTSTKVAEALARKAVRVEEQRAVLALLSEWIRDTEPQRVQFPAMSLAAAAPENFAVPVLQLLLRAGHILDPNWSILLTRWPAQVITQVNELLRASTDPDRLLLLRICQAASGRFLAESSAGFEACLASHDAEVVRLTCQTLVGLAGEPVGPGWQNLAPAMLSAWRLWTSIEEGGVSGEIESLWGQIPLALPEELLAGLSARPQVTMVRPDRIFEVVIEPTFSAPFDPQQQPWRSHLAQCSAAAGEEALYLLAPPRLYYLGNGRESQSWLLPERPPRQTCSLLWTGDHGDIFCTLGIFGQVRLCYLDPEVGKWMMLAPLIAYEGLAQAPLRRLSTVEKGIRYAWTDQQRAYHIDVSAGTIQEAAVEAVLLLPPLTHRVGLDIRNSVKDWRRNPLSGERDSASTSLVIPSQVEKPLVTRVTFVEGRAVGLEAFPERRLVVYGWNRN